MAARRAAVTRLTLVALLLPLALALGGVGCATAPVTGFHRARPLGQGHAEIGGAVSLGRQPAEGAVVTVDDRGREGEGTFGFPAPSLHFRIGIDERLGAGLETWPGGVKLHGRYGVLDTDELMLAVVGGIGTWSSGADAGEDELVVRSPLMLSLHVPLATRPLPWLELNLTPTVEVVQLQAERQAFFDLQERSYMTIQSGFVLGANFAIWRVRISPELGLLGVYRSDRDDGFIGVYPGVGAFLVY